MTDHIPHTLSMLNEGLLGERYGRLLEKHGVARAYNHWCFMPGLAEQHKRMQEFTAPFIVLRLLTPSECAREQPSIGRGIAK